MHYNKFGTRDSRKSMERFIGREKTGFLQLDKSVWNGTTGSHR